MSCRAGMMVALIVGALVGCGGSDGEAPAESVPPAAPAADEAPTDQLDEDLWVIEPTAWVTALDPAAAQPGYTLILYRRRIPMLVDLMGRPVHAWPRVRAIGRARLDEQGRLLTIGIDDRVKLYDWRGKLLWAYELPVADDLPHHDAIVLENGNVLVLAKDSAVGADYLHEVDPHGRVVWEWRAADHEAGLPATTGRETDRTHVNSVHELPPNRWSRAGDERFRPGNLLLSARNLNTVFVVDKETKEIVWSYTGDLDWQHEATMVPEGWTGAGLIALFDNRYHRPSDSRSSIVLAIDPTTKETVWSYEHPTFFSSVGGTQQPLPNGNVLITSSHGGRIFEITLDGRIVWEMIPPYFPMRALRYPPDHCPQFDAFDPPGLEPIERPEPDWIDYEAYFFALPEELPRRQLHGANRHVVEDERVCRSLWLPREATLKLRPMLDPELVGDGEIEARFRATLRPRDGGAERTLVDRTIRSSDEKLLFEHREPLGQLARQRVELCLMVETSSDLPPERERRAAVWERPKVDTTIVDWSLPERPTGEAELKLRERQLRAIGYLQ